VTGRTTQAPAFLGAVEATLHVVRTVTAATVPKSAGVFLSENLMEKELTKEQMSDWNKILESVSNPDQFEKYLPSAADKRIFISQWKLEEYDNHQPQPKTGDFWSDYDRYLQSSHWAELRQIVIKRDGNKCQNCFRTVLIESAHVHHISYDGFKRTGKSFAFECVALCRKCHKEYHQKK